MTKLKKINSKIDFIRKSLPFIKILRDNKYIKDIEIFKVKKEKNIVFDIEYDYDYNYECKFIFAPFADDSNIELRFFIDESVLLKNNVLMYCLTDDIVPSKLIDDYCMGFSTTKLIDIDEFNCFFNTAHNWVIDVILIQSINSKHNSMLCKKYIPDSFMSGNELNDYIKSRQTLIKFNL